MPKVPKITYLIGPIVAGWAIMTAMTPTNEQYLKVRTYLPCQYLKHSVDTAGGNAKRGAEA